MFHFNAGDISGSFAFDNSGDINNIRLIPYQDLQVKAYRASSNHPIHKFEITTAAGTKYFFEDVETTVRKSERLTSNDPFFSRREYHQFKSELTFNSGWKLTRIRSAVGEEMLFAYSTVSKTSGSKFSPAIKKSTNDDILFKDQFSVGETITKKAIASITTLHQQIDFNATGHTGTMEGIQLHQIVIKELDAVAGAYYAVKTISFGLRYAFSSVANEPSNGRMYLSRISISDNCQTFPSYNFEYNNTDLYPASGGLPTISLPNPGSKNQDIWGYYLNNASANNVPKVYVYPSLAGINKISLYQKSGQSDEIVIDGANRLNASTPTNGVLSKIKYPSGAVATFQYEPHQFYNPVTASVTGGGGLRLSSVKLHDGISYDNDITKIYEYLQSDGTTSSGKLMALPTFWQLVGCYKDPVSGAVTTYDDLSSFSATEQWRRLLLRTEDNVNPDFDATNPVVYSRVTEKISSGKGKTVYSYNVPYSYGTTVTDYWKPTYTHLARPSDCPSSGLNTAGYFYSPFSPQTPYDWQKGILLSVATYAEGESNPLKETLYEYQEKTVSPVTIKGLRYEFIPYSSVQHYYMFGAYLLSTNALNVISRIKERVRDRENPISYIETITDYTYGTDHALISTSTVTNSDGSTLTERFKYAKDYGAPGSTTPDLQVNLIDALNTAGQTGELVEQTMSRNVPSVGEKTYSGMVNIFENFGTTPAPVILPKEILVLRTDGISSFVMSSFSGSGSSRTFSKHAAYKSTGSFTYKAPGDILRIEDQQRQIQSVHPDIRTGLPVARIKNVEPGEVIFSGFDHDTDYDFDLISFTAGDKAAAGRTGAYGLKGWTSGSGKYLEKQFKKKPGAKYIFSAWYKPAVTTGTHTLNLVVRNTASVLISQQTITYTISSEDWHYAQQVVDLSGVSDTDVIIEVLFSGSYSSSNTSILDDVTFSPEGIEVTRSTYAMPFGVSSVTAPDGSIVKKEYDGRGKLRYVRDHDNNIVEKTSYSNWTDVAGNGSPISFTAPSTIIATVPTEFTAKTSCVDVSTFEWKVSTTISGGSFVSGTSPQSHTFTDPGIYWVTLKVSHSSYGSYEYKQSLTVSPKPLDVSMCIVEGSAFIDLCATTALQSESCSGPVSPPATVDKSYTIFQVSVSGCTSGTYSYEWMKRPLGQLDGQWGFIGSGSNSISINNYQSYEVRCLVTSSCGYWGEAVQSVYIYSSDPNCSISLPD